MPPLISICVPMYNGEKYLEECLESIKNQTFTDYEVIIVDDGSGDSSLEIAKRYAAGDERFQVHRNEMNLGLVGNWNRCIEIARGEWIKFLFQDDYLDEEYLEKSISAAGEKYSLIFCRRKFVFSNVTPEVKQEYLNIDTFNISKIYGKYGYITPEEVSQGVVKTFPGNIFGEPTSFLIRKEIFEKYGMFEKDLFQLCDYEFWIRVATHEGVYFLPEDLVFFRVHDASTSAKNRKTNKMVLDQLILLHSVVFSQVFKKLRSVTGVSVFSAFFWNQLNRRIAIFYDIYPTERFNYRLITNNNRLEKYNKFKILITLLVLYKKNKYYFNAVKKRVFSNG